MEFFHIDGRYTEETDLPWDYRGIVLHTLKPDMKLLSYPSYSIISFAIVVLFPIGTVPV